MARVSWTTHGVRQEYMIEEEVLIGRAAANDIQFPDLGVSGVHARIVNQDGKWILEDKGSTNGTHVQGQRIDRYELKDGDEIDIGNIRLKFSCAATPLVGPSQRGAHANASAPGARTMSVDGHPQETGFVTVNSVHVEESLSNLWAGEDSSILAMRLKAACEMSKATAATLNLTEVMSRVLDALLNIFTAADRAFILLANDEMKEISVAAAKQRMAKEPDEISISRSAVQQCMERREVALCHDAMNDSRYAGSQSIMDLHIRAMMIAPLVFRDRVMGVIQVDTHRGTGSFAQSDLELLSVAASQVAACLANAELHKKVVASERLAAVGQTFAGLTHCIKNILQGIQGGGYILDSALSKGDMKRLRSGWDMVKRSNAFMQDLVQDLLNFSKERKPEYRSVDLNQLCATACDLPAARGKDKGVTVTFKPDPNLTRPVELDANGMRRGLLNLLMNGVDACAGNGGTVTLETYAPQEDGFVRIAVRDTGCGMSEATLARLFTVFFSTKGAKGTGLGLPVTKKLIEEHGGRLDVASREGAGTTFTISLPPERDQGHQAAAEETAGSAV